MNIYIGNIAYEASEQDLQNLYEQYGQVSSAKIVIDRETGRSRGFGFVEMPDDSEGQKAIEGTNGQEFMGRSLKVNQARERENTRGDRGDAQRRRY